jgi:hypothetical protein
MMKNVGTFQIVGMHQMEQRSVALFLQVKSLSKKAIHHELVAMLQENALSYSNVTRFCREPVLGRNWEDVSPSPKAMASMK